jgi:signal-transduction protein with cAMP-binding, CBS, and nucleotidyltransferase domain
MFHERDITTSTKRVCRLPVLRDGKLVGIVTRHDPMHAIRDARRRIQLQRAHEPRQREKIAGPDRQCVEVKHAGA